MNDGPQKPPFALTAKAILAAAARPLPDDAADPFVWWADLADAVGPVLLPFLTRPECYDRAPTEELGLEPTPLRSLTPQRGEMWVLFCYRAGEMVEALRMSPLRSDGFPLILEWRSGGEDSPLLSSALRALASCVRGQLGVDGWSLHPAFDRYGDQVDFSDSELFSDSEHVDSVASAWGALASGLWCVTTGRYPPEWPFPSVQWDERRGCVAGVAGVREKLSVAADCGAAVVTLARAQRREAAGLLADLREGPDGGRFRHLRLHAVRDIRDARSAAAEIAFGFASGRRCRRRIVALVLAPFLTMLALCGLHCWDTHRSFSKYYAAVVCHYGLPQGLYEVSPEEQRCRGSTFRFDYRGVHDGKSIHDPWQLKTVWGRPRKLVRVVHVNARNVPCPLANDGFGQMPMIQEFEYSAAGKLKTVKSRKRGGDDFVSGPVEKQFAYRDFGSTTNGCVALLDGEGNFWYGDASLSQSESLLPQDGKSVVNHYVLARDAAGRVLRKEFRSGGWLDPVGDGDGVGGMAFEYNDDGLVKRRVNLDVGSTNGVPNQWGVVSTSFLWDGPQLTNVVARNSLGKMVCDRIGVMQYAYRYDSHGNLESLAFLDADGRPTCNQASREWPVRVAEYRFSWTNGLKRSVMRLPLPGEERQALCPEGETSGELYAYDGLGDVAEVTGLDAAGNATTNSTGYCKLAYVNDWRTGEPLRISVFALDGKTPAKDRFGVCAYSNVLDDAGNCLASYMFGASGKLTLNSYGAAVLRKEYDRQNRLTYELRLGADGRPAGSSTFPALEVIYRHGRRSELRFCAGDESRTSSTNFEGASRIALHYDDAGHLLRRAYHALPGTGNSIHPRKGPACARYELLFDGKGNMTAVKHYDADGKLLPMPNSRHAYGLFEYDRRGRMTAFSYYGVDDLPVAVGSNSVNRIEMRYAQDGSHVIDERRYYALGGKLLFVRKNPENSHVGK